MRKKQTPANWRAHISCRILAAAVTFIPNWAGAQSRADENAITQADDAFGFRIGRESLGIYDAANARGFSPATAGNLRIDGLYFDQVYPLQGTLTDSTSIKVGLSAQGYPFTAPSGIVDQSLRRPSTKGGASVVANFDSFGSFGVEVDGSLPIGPTLTIGYGLVGSHVEYPDGSDNWNHTQSVLVRWKPAADVEITPFWGTTNNYDDEATVVYVPAGKFLPKLPKARHYEGARWSDYHFVALNTGVLASANLARNWSLRFGAFRSVHDLQTSFTNILANEQPDGTGERLLFADPQTRSWSNSGELRLSHSVPDGPRLHVVHLSARIRDARREFGGSELIDLGLGRVGERIREPAPDRFHFSEVSHDRVRQATTGIAYDGRWKNVGEISFGLSKPRFRKETQIPGLPVAVTKASPWLYNATAAVELTKSLAAYGGYSRGLEESGTAPPNAANRNQPLPAILTQQKDAGIRAKLANGMIAAVGLFDLRRPYFGFDSTNLFKQIGAVRSRGAEFSITGSVTKRLDVVAGGMLLEPKVSAGDAADTTIGSKPVGLPSHLLIGNLNWKAPFIRGFELDLALSHRGRTPATTDNLVSVPARGRLDLGTHYRFDIARRSATLRLQLVNVFDKIGYNLAGSGAYLSSPGRSLQGYLTVDI